MYIGSAFPAQEAEGKKATCFQYITIQAPCQWEPFASFQRLVVEFGHTPRFLPGKLTLKKGGHRHESENPVCNCSRRSIVADYRWSSLRRRHHHP
jgi:hypothetical protein